MSNADPRLSRYLLASIWMAHDEKNYETSKAHMKPGHITFRYTETQGTYLLQSWHLQDNTHANTEDDESGATQATPEWLRLILDIAELGEHMVYPPYPPPEKILWFTTDKDHNLINFNNDYGQFLLEEANK